MGRRTQPRLLHMASQAQDARCLGEVCLPLHHIARQSGSQRLPFKIVAEVGRLSLPGLAAAAASVVRVLTTISDLRVELQGLFQRRRLHRPFRQGHEVRFRHCCCVLGADESGSRSAEAHGLALQSRLSESAEVCLSLYAGSIPEEPSLGCLASRPDRHEMA